MSLMSLPPQSVLRDPARRWSWLVAHLKGRGTCLAKVARRMEVTRAAVQGAKYKPYPRVEAAIARELNVAVQTLFPDRYDADGVPTARPVGRPRKLLDETVRQTRSRSNRQGAVGR